MLQSVTFKSKNINPLEVMLRNPDPSGFTIRSISGLDAGSTNLHLSELATIPGSIFGGSRKSTREIVFDFGYGPSESPERQRSLSYSVFPLGEMVNLRFLKQGTILEIDGIVESNDADIFTDTPGFQITLLCPKVYFRSISDSARIIEFVKYEKEFEFPFSNESLDTPELVMGNYTSKVSEIISYNGDVENGINIDVFTSSTLSDITISNITTGQALVLNTSLITTLTGKAFGQGDRLEINTNRGSRSITLIRGTTRYNVINIKTKASEWLTLRKGDNEIGINSSLGVNAITVSVKIQELYVGI